MIVYFVRPGADEGSQTLFEKAGETVRTDVTGPKALNDVHRSRTAVLEGIGLGFFMERSVLTDIEEGRLVRVLEDWTPASPGICIYYPGRRNTSAAVKAFVGMVRELTPLPA